MQFNDLMLRRFMDDRMRDLESDARMGRLRLQSRGAWRLRLARLLLAAARRLAPDALPSARGGIGI